MDSPLEITNELINLTHYCCEPFIILSEALTLHIYKQCEMFTVIKRLWMVKERRKKKFNDYKKNGEVITSQ